MERGKGSLQLACTPAETRTTRGGPRIDSGSTTTKIVVAAPDGSILFTHYAPNLGNPIEAVRRGLTELKQQCDTRQTELAFIGSCSTGYGEELIKAAFALDGSMIETMAHYKAARQMAPDVSFILDIGGQDMKAIFVKQGAIIRMELNEGLLVGVRLFHRDLCPHTGAQGIRLCPGRLHSLSAV